MNVADLKKKTADLKAKTGGTTSGPTTTVKSAKLNFSTPNMAARGSGAGVARKMSKPVGKADLQKAAQVKLRFRKQNRIMGAKRVYGSKKT